MKCKFCGLNYKNNYTRHVNICKIIHNKHDAVPNNKIMYELLKYVIIENNKLKDKISNLEMFYYKNKKTKVKNMNVIDWLNTNKKIDYDIHKWMKNINIIDTDLTICINKGFVKGVLLILLNNIKKHEKFIYSFKSLNNKFYVYINNKWDVLDIKLLQFLIIRNIKPNLILLYKKKYDSNSNEYQTKLRSILGTGNSKRDINKILKLLYKELSIDFKSLLNI